MPSAAAARSAAAAQAPPEMPVSRQKRPLPARSCVEILWPPSAQPAVRQARARPGRRVVVELAVARVAGLRRAVGHDGRGRVALPELDAVGVELVVLELERLLERDPLARRLGRVVGAGAHVLGHHLRVARVGEAQRLEDRAELLDRLVGAQHDLAPDRHALGVVAVEQALAGLPVQHQRELPGQVVGVLDRGVGAQAVARRVPVDGVAHAEHAALAVAGGVHLVVAPQRRRADRDRDRVVADQAVDDPRRGLVVELGRQFVDVVAPDDQPLVPRAHHAHEAHADAADVRAGLQHPVQDARAVLDERREVGVEDDVHRAGDVHLALERQPDVGGHLRAPAVGADHVLGADLVGVAGQAVAHGHGHAVVVLDQADVLRVEPDPRAAVGGVADQDRLEQRLRQVAGLARARQRVVGLARGVRAPGAHAADLVPGQARAEHGVAHQSLRRAVGQDVVLDAEVAHDLDRALVGDVRARRVGRPAVLGDDDVVHARGGQEQRGGRAGGARADDEDVGGRDVRSCQSEVEGHAPPGRIQGAAARSVARALAARPGRSATP